MTHDPQTGSGSPGSLSRGLRWFAAEFLVVVLGILVALALQAWWAGREARADERVVLTQMLSDLTEDSLRLSQGAAQDSAGIEVASRILEHMDTHESFADSLASVVAGLGMATTASLQKAQYQTLQAKGLGLIRNDDLRSAIVTFYEVTGASLDNHNQWLSTAEDRWMPMMLRRFRMGVLQRPTDAGAQFGSPQTAHPRDYAALRRDEEFRLFLDEYVYYMRYTAPWKLGAMERASDLMSEIREALN